MINIGSMSVRGRSEPEESSVALLRRYAAKLTGYADRLSSLPDEAGAWSSLYSILAGDGSMGKKHAAFSALIDSLEHAHWVECAKWLLAERDWQATRTAWRIPLFVYPYPPNTPGTAL